ncbi:SDR family oxidoreductase [Paenibacillus sp. FJAT-26967]|uniref:SDR family oxidoreductase n=1 Tax=Paenibacillus sp. FJAT-26967 TaxID=1729690 RepID=UPI0008393574|nr:SDR family oxidoreductase [Paenibacillus sp. FJAT-26967]
MGSLDGKIAIVTGASRRQGIGAAVCRLLAQDGADIFFTHLSTYDTNVALYEVDENWPDVFTGELQKLGIRAGHMELDISQPDAPEKLLNKVEAAFGAPPTILINNATYSVDADFRELSPAILDEHCAVNVRGTCMMSAMFARRIEGRHTGRIVNLVSGQDKGPQPGNLAYVATKGAISAFTRSLAAGLAEHGITVNAVDPGPTDTGWISDDLRAQLLPQFPLGRLGVPDDAARLIAFLASEEARWITGQIIHSDGGFR